MKIRELTILTALAIAVFLCNATALALGSPHSPKHHKTVVSEHSSKKIHHTVHRTRGRHSSQLASQSKSSCKKHRHAVPKVKYAYPMSIFLFQPPPFDSTPLPEDENQKIRKAFTQGTAAEYPTRSLVRARLVTYYPIRGGIFFRREPIKNIIMHSTEPGRPISARAVIDGWSHGGRRHPGAHYVVERDGTIYQALDPDLGAVHVNIFKTLPGFDNDNSVGVEMCHQGSQDYPPEQMLSVIKLVVYLQNHYHVSDSNIVTHRYAQQGDHTDPVNFAWANFIADKTSLQNQSLNYRLAELKAEAVAWHPIEEPGLGKTKIYKGNKSVVIDLTNTNGAPVPTGGLNIEKATADKQTSETMAKLSPVKSIESTSDLTSAPIPSSAGINLVPVTNGSVSRLVPALPVNRLVPASRITNDGSGSGIARGAVRVINGSNTSTYTQIDAASAPAVPINSKTLPLRGPIEMDPNEAADLLNRGSSSQ